MKRSSERRILHAALAASLVAHALVLAARPAEPPKRPRYIVLETRLELPGAPGEGRLMTADRPHDLATEAAAGGKRRQSATSQKEGARVALSPLTLPVAFQQEKRFEPGQDLSARERTLGLTSLAPPDLATYFRASELDELAVPQADANLDFDALRFAEPGLSSVRLRVLINELGVVDDVHLTEDASVPPAMYEQIRAAFLVLRFFPAQKDGHVVKSQKLVELFPQPDAPS
jgi:hypothetical protein